jgi:hypothetical protein
LCNTVAPTVTTPCGTIPTAATEGDDSQGPAKRAGRPKGTTQASKKDIDDVISEFIE